MADEASKDIINIFRSHGHVEVDTAILCKYLYIHMSFSAYVGSRVSMIDIFFLPTPLFSFLMCISMNLIFIPYQTRMERRKKP